MCLWLCYSLVKMSTLSSRGCEAFSRGDPGLDCHVAKSAPRNDSACLREAAKRLAVAIQVLDCRVAKTGTRENENPRIYKIIIKQRVKTIYIPTSLLYNK